MKIKCVIRISIYEINLDFINHFYINALNYVDDLAIIQFQLTLFIKVFNKTLTLIKIFIIYDFFAFASTRRKYLIYKRKLYVIVKFIKKYDYLCKHIYHTAVIHINHKSLTYFLKSDIYEKVYEH